MKKLKRVVLIVVGAWLAIVIGASLIVGAAKLFTKKDSDKKAAAPSRDATADRKEVAFEACTRFVKQKLKSPSTATFRNQFDDDGEVSITGIGDGPYEVVSTVDSENGFGAKIRSAFTCTVSSDERGWSLVDLKFG